MKQIKCYCGHTTTCDCAPLQKQTAMQELRDWVNIELKLLNYEHPIILNKIDILLEKEKEQIISVYWDSYNEGRYGTDKTAEQYYNQTFKQDSLDKDVERLLPLSICIDFIKKTEAILKNGYYHHFGSFCFITYNSGNQKDLNVYQTVNLLLSKSLSELLKIDEESARNLISNYYDNAKRFDTLDIIKELKDCNIIIADRHKIVCANNIDNVAKRH